MSTITKYFNCVTEDLLTFHMEIGNIRYVDEILERPKNGLSPTQKTNILGLLQAAPRDSILPSDSRKALKNRVSAVLPLPRKLPYLPSVIASQSLSLLTPSEIGRIASTNSFFHREGLAALRQQFKEKAHFTYKELEQYRKAFHLQTIGELFLMDPEHSKTREISLTIDNTDLSDAQFKALIVSCPALASIKLRLCSHITDASIMALAQHHPQTLKDIWIESSTQLRDASLFFRHFPLLERIALKGEQAFDAAFFEQIPQDCPHLAAIDISVNRAFLPPEILNALYPKCPSLTEIHTLRNSLNPEHMQKLAPNLKKISFSGGNIDIYRRLIQRFPDILIMNSCFNLPSPLKDITTAQLRELIDLIKKHFPELRELDILTGLSDRVMGQYDDSGKTLIKILPHCPKLREIIASHEGFNRITLSPGVSISLAAHCPDYLDTQVSQYQKELACKARTELGKIYQNLLKQIIVDNRPYEWNCFKGVIQKTYQSLRPFPRQQIYNRISPNQPMILSSKIDQDNMASRVLCNYTLLCDTMHNFLSTEHLKAILNVFPLSNPNQPVVDLLKKIPIDRFVIDNLEQFQLALFSHDGNAENVDSSKFPQITDDFFISILNYAPRLKSIDISNCKWLTEKSIDRLKDVPLLATVNLKNLSKLTDSSIIGLAKSCPELRKVDFAGCNSLTDEAVFALAEHSHKLETVNLSGCSKLTEASLIALVQKCPLLSDLQTTIWDSCTDSAAIAFAKSRVYVDGIKSLAPDFSGRIAYYKMQLTIRPRSKLGKYYTFLMNALNVKAITQLQGYFLDVKFPNLSLQNETLFYENFMEFCENISSFIESKDCPPLPEEVSAFFSKLESQKKLDLSEYPDIEESFIINKLKEYSNEVNDIDLGGCTNVTNKTLDVISSYCKGVKRLNLMNCTRVDHVAISTMLRHLIIVEEINISGIYIPAIVLSQIADTHAILKIINDILED